MVAVSILNTSIGPDKRWSSRLIYVEGPKVKRDILFSAINLTGSVSTGGDGGNSF